VTAIFSQNATGFQSWSSKEVMRTPLALQIATLLLAATVGLGASPGPLWLIFVDDLHLDFINTGWLRTALRTVASELIREGDAFAARSSGPSSLSLDVTSDRARLDAAVKKATGNGLRPPDMDNTPAAVLEVRYRADAAFAAARDLIASAEPVRDRRKALIYVSNGYVDNGSRSDRPPALAHIAGVAGVTIFTVDPRLLVRPLFGDRRMSRADWERYWDATRNSLRLLAEMSGGFALEDGDLAGTLKRIDRMMRD
jgi:hypothetical protein